MILTERFEHSAQRRPTASMIALRVACPDYGRPPRGRPLWQAGLLIMYVALMLAAVARGWI